MWFFVIFFDFFLIQMCFDSNFITLDSAIQLETTRSILNFRKFFAR